MEKRAFGRTGMEVAVLGFGGAEIGFDRIDQGVATRLLNSALDSGLNVIDTAECYLASEELIGKAVGRRRADYHLFTKCGHPVYPGLDDWRPRSLLKGIRRSLKRLRTDHLDLIQLHGCSEEELRRGEVIEALEAARKKGYARFIGYSGDAGAARFAVESGRFDALQTSINIADQEAIELTLPLAGERGIGVIAKRPIANAMWRLDRPPENGSHVSYWERLRTLAYDFATLDDHAEAAAIALRFTLGVPGVSTAIVGTTKPDRWAQNAAIVAEGPLGPDRFEAIRRRWAAVAGPSWVGQS